MIIAMRAHATKPDAPPKLICLMMSGRGSCPHLRSPDKRGSTVLYIRDSQLNRPESVSLASLARQLLSWYVQILFL